MSLAQVEAAYVQPFYLELLGGGPFRLAGSERERFDTGFRWAIYAVTVDEVTTLLSSQLWRAELVGGWLVAAVQWQRFLPKVSELLLASRRAYAGRGYCIALARVPGSESAATLVRYLDRYLREPALVYNQPEALAALFMIDHALGTHHADRFVEDGGMWEQWRQAQYPAGPDLGRTRQALSASLDYLANLTND